MVDDDGDFLAAARADDALVAMLLICLSRSEVHASCRQLAESSKPPTPSPSAEAEGIFLEPQPTPPLLSQTRTWGRRRARSEGAPAAKSGDEAGRSSPATPLSWSGTSGTSGSGSGSEDGWSTPPRPEKRRSADDRGESCQPPRPASKQRTEVPHGGVEQIGVPAAKGTATKSCGNRGPAGIQAPIREKVGRPDEDGEPHGRSMVGATAADGSPSGSGSGFGKGVTAELRGGVGPRRSVAHAQPLRSRLTGERANLLVFGRPGKKKTVLELRAMKESLLREQEQLQKELGRQRGVYDALLEENVALKKLESSFPSLTASKPTATLVCGEAKSEEPQHMLSAPECQAPQIIGATYVLHDEDSPEQPHCTNSICPLPACTFLFDLNCLPDGDL